MRLLFKQRLFSWFDCYDIYNEAGKTAYTVEGQLSWGHCLKIYDPRGNEVGTVKERILTWMPKFEMYLGQQYIGCIRKEFSLFTPRYNIEYKGWKVDGNLFGWDYQICDRTGTCIAIISKGLWNWSDTYTIDVANPADALYALMLVLAIDAEKCSQK